MTKLIFILLLVFGNIIYGIDLERDLVPAKTVSDYVEVLCNVYNKQYHQNKENPGSMYKKGNSVIFTSYDISGEEMLKTVISEYHYPIGDSRGYIYVVISYEHETSGELIRKYELPPFNLMYFDKNDTQQTFSMEKMERLIFVLISVDEDFE